MTGKLSKVLFSGVLILVSLGFFIVPLGETSGSYDIEEGVTPSPSPITPEIRTFSPLPSVDISQSDASPTRITDVQCCSYAGWSSDSEWILYLDGEADRTPSGLYSTPRDGGGSSLLTAKYGVFSPDWSYVAYVEDGQVFIEQWASKLRWTVPSNGRAVSISPDLTHIAWEFGSQSIQSPDRRQTQVWIARITGDEPRELITLHGGAFQGWVDGSRAVIATGRLAPSTHAGIWRIDTATGAAQLLFEVETARGLTLSASGEWMAFFVAFEQDPDRNGIWVMKTDGSNLQRLRRFGAYRWRSEGQLLLIPLDLAVETPGLYQIDIPNGRMWRLIDPKRLTLDISNNDWSVSPDGQWLLYQSAADRNLWVLELPQPPNSP